METISATTWDEALKSAAEKINSFSAEEIAIIGSARMTNEELLMLESLRETLSTPHLSLVPRVEEADKLLIAADRNPNTTGAKLVLGKDDPYSSLDGIRTAVRDGRIKALLVFGEDPLNDAGFTAEDLGKLDFFLQTALLANPSAEHADIVLPAAAFAEKRGSMVNLTGRLQRLNRAVEPPLHARDDWEILRDLAAAVSGKSPDHYLIEDVFRQLASSVPAFEGLTLSKIGDQGTVIHETDYKIALLENERARAAAGEITG